MKFIQELREAKVTDLNLGDAFKKLIVTFRDTLKEKGLSNVIVTAPFFSVNTHKSGDVHFLNSFTFASTNSFWGVYEDLITETGVFVKGDDYKKVASVTTLVNKIVNKIFKEDILPHFKKNDLSELYYLGINKRPVYFKDDRYVFLTKNHEVLYDKFSLADLEDFMQIGVVPNHIFNNMGIQYTKIESNSVMRTFDALTNEVILRKNLDSLINVPIIRVGGILCAAYFHHNHERYQRIFLDQMTPYIDVNINADIIFNGVKASGNHFGFKVTSYDFGVDVVVDSDIMNAVEIKTFEDKTYISLKPNAPQAFANSLNSCLPGDWKIIPLADGTYEALKVHLTNERNKLGFRTVNVDHRDILVLDDETEANYRACDDYQKQQATEKLHYDYRKNSLNFLPLTRGQGNPLYMGVEIEVDEGGNSHANAEMLLTALTNKKPYALAKHDGSLGYGLEIVTDPATLEAHRDTNYFNYERFFRTAKALGFTGSSNSTAGLHVHVNKNFFSNPTLAGKLLMMLIELWWEGVSTIAGRSDSRYAKVLHVSRDYKTLLSNDKPTLKSYLDLREMWSELERHYRSDRYVALNVRNSNTFEFRMFKSTLNIQAFFAVLEFVDALCRHVENVTKELDGMEQSNVISSDTILKATKMTFTEFVDKLCSKKIKARLTKGSHDDHTNYNEEEV